MQEIFSKASAHIAALGTKPDHAALVAICDNALDNDAGLAGSGLQQIGLSIADKEALDMWALTTGADAEALAVEIENADDAVAGADDAAELAAMAGVPLPPPPSLPPLPAAPPAAPVAGLPPIPPTVETGAPPPKPAKHNRGGPVEGAVPPRVFKLLREHVKVKDDEMGGLLGVSRQTYINYGKDNAKAQFVPSDTQREVLVNLVAAHRDALNEALSLLGAA